jgi:hypothetical protein
VRLLAVGHRLGRWGKHDVHLRQPAVRLSPAPMLAIATLLLACRSFGPGALVSTGAPSSPFVAHSVTAAEACQAVVEDPIQAMIVVRSGKAQVSAAYALTGDELASYLEKASSANGLGDSSSVWRTKAETVVQMCLIDGDLFTQTPGPPEADRTAVRVLVVISNGDAQLWAIARADKSQLPLRDTSTSE